MSVYAVLYRLFFNLDARWGRISLQACLHKLLLILLLIRVSFRGFRTLLA